MRHLVHMLAFTLTAEPPQFEVVNKCPPTFAVVNRMPVVPEVTAVKSFRSGGYHSGHDCPVCGRSQYVIESGRKNGTHTHRCSADGTVWFH